MHRVAHNGRETAYRRIDGDGAGPTTLYVHGSGADHRCWVSQYRPDGPAHPAIAVDLSGHGESEDIETETTDIEMQAGQETLAAYAADVAAVAHETNPDVVVGHSLGGAVVFELLLEGLYQPEAVVFAGTGAKLAVHESVRTMLREDFAGVVEALHGGLLFSEADTELAQASRVALLATGQRITRRDFLTCHRFDVRDRLEEITVPALALVGEDDRMTPPSYHEYLAENIPECEYAVIEDAGHLAMLEQPTAFNAAVAAFMDSRLRSD